MLKNPKADAAEPLIYLLLNMEETSVQKAAAYLMKEGGAIAGILDSRGNSVLQIPNRIAFELLDIMHMRPNTL